MVTHRHADQRLTLTDLAAEFGLSISTWRRALRDRTDPLPHQRAGLGSPSHARVLVRRGDVEEWLRRRNAALTTPVRDIVNEVVAKVTGGGA